MTRRRDATCGPCDGSGDGYGDGLPDGSGEGCGDGPTDGSGDGRGNGSGEEFSIPILWDDLTALVAAKPSGLLTHNSAWAGPPEESLQRRLLGSQGGPLHPVHRLDRGASGVVIFARSSAAVAGWQAALTAPEASKLYLALVRGRLEEAVLVDHPIRDGRASGSEVTARQALSEVRPVAVSEVDRCSLVEVRLRTGRRHQVRRHLKHLSHPVLGDTTWGKGAVNRHFREAYGLRRLALHGALVEVRHPQTGKAIVFAAPLPPDLTGPLALLFPERPGIWQIGPALKLPPGGDGL